MARSAGAGTILLCNFALGASTPQALHELQRLHDDMGGAVFVRTLQLQYDLAGAVTLEPFVGDGPAG